MLQTVGDEPGTAILTIKSLKAWVHAEFTVFTLFVKFTLTKKLKQAKGNAFAQGIHDGGTLTSGKKFQVFGLQFVDPLWEHNFVLCLALKRSPLNTNAVVALIFDKTLIERTGHPLKTLVSSMIADRAAKGVAESCELEMETRLHVELNTTRVAAQHGLVHSELRMYKALSLYQVVNKPSWALSDDQWVGAAEVEATLCITKTTTTCCQYEKVFAGAYGALIKGTTMNNLRAGYLDIVDVQKVSKTGGLPRIRKYDLSALGQQCVKRATLEGKRRFCGNVTEELTGAGVEMSDRPPTEEFAASETWAVISELREFEYVPSLQQLLFEHYLKRDVANAGREPWETFVLHKPPNTFRLRELLGGHTEFLKEVVGYAYPHNEVDMQVGPLLEKWACMFIYNNYVLTQKIEGDFNRIDNSGHRNASVDTISAVTAKRQVLIEKARKREIAELARVVKEVCLCGRRVKNLEAFTAFNVA
ncbi:hypothetical protein CYMTET_30596 [Cymbomonas tetramitiformis]|uniref:Uncharacterized protein n=1 Tax=Cymbomonas tetramitiformis TaxID=36881 RepID=A0AAE0FII5_9CHLO|nr:hypothetical protein CYMTET_30596 [Cymbomonas tetramitiformis]